MRTHTQLTPLILHGWRRGISIILQCTEATRTAVLDLGIPSTYYVPPAVGGPRHKVSKRRVVAGQAATEEAAAHTAVAIPRRSSAASAGGSAQAAGGMA
jgi:hypothetical protein